MVGGLAAFTISVGSLATHQVYVEAVVAPVGPSDLSPLLSPNDPVAQTVGALTGPGLMAAGRHGGAELGLATSWKSEDGGSRYRFTLSPGRRWSNGKSVTTKDVAFTMAVLQSSRFPNADLAAPWTGVSLFASSLWSGTFVLPGPSTSFPTAAEDAILPAQHYRSQPALFFRGDQRTDAEFAPSAGPFRVSGNGAAAVSLSRNPYYRPRPRLDGFHLLLEPSSAAVDQLLAQGQVDGWLAATPTDLQGLPAGLVRSRITTYDFVELLLNEEANPLDLLQVRQAISDSIDRATLIKQELAGLGDPQYGPLPDSIAWAHSASGATSASSPASLLEAAGWRRSGHARLWEQNGQPLTLTIEVPNLDPLPEAAAGVASQLEAKGFLVRVRSLPESSFVSGTLSQEQFQAALVGFDNGPDSDLTSFWRSGVEPGQSLNFSQAAPDLYLNHALDALATASSAAARESAYREVAKRLRTDLPAVFLYTPVDVYVHLSSVHVPGVGGVGDPSQRFRRVADWSL
ncbi:MAG TPA: ABC transporter substrate-binding protein [Candidatus Dormibacteraeota bacterium]